MTKTHRLNLWRFGNYKIDTFDVVKQTAKTVTVRTPYDVGEGFAQTFRDDKYNLLSQDYAFFDTLEKAERVAVRLVSARIEHYEAEVKMLKRRLQEVCPHIAITNPQRDSRCTKCNLAVTNPNDYTAGGG